MNDTCNTYQIKPTLSLVGIILVFTTAGACAGFAGGQLTTRLQAAKEVENIRVAYDESQKVRGEALRMCLMLAPKAADSAATAATAAGAAAGAAQRALEQKSADDRDQATP